MRLLIDMSSLLWQSLLASKDNEFGVEVEHEGRTVHVNGWQHGYECAMNHLLSVMEELDVVPIDCIFVCEGKMAKSRRKSIYNQYKEGRDSRPPLAYEQFAICRDKLCETFLNVGSQVVTQEGVEADDILAFLARRLKGEMVILTTDGDMATLINENVSLWRGGMLTKVNPYGKFSTRYVPLYKALCGDGNEYKGAAGFGPKAFEALLAWAGEPGLAALEGMIRRRTLAELIDDVKEFKPTQKILDSAEHVYQSYECALLHDEWVDTMRQPLQWKAGMVRGQDVVTDSRLHKWAQKVTLVTADNYDNAMSVLKENVGKTPAWALDIETSTPPESDEWLRAGERENKVDVFGSMLTSMGLTFGPNNNFTLYFSVDHFDTNNVASKQVMEAVKSIPSDKHIVIQNFAFEGPILYNEWGKDMADNGWHGFLPNVVDTVFCASYVDENISSGLKQGSKHYLGYDQITYNEVTTVGDVQFKMNQLTAEHVLKYGADDPICTIALYNHFKTRMELENTWDVMMEVEQKASYVVALAFHCGTAFSLQRMKELQAHDAEVYATEWAKLREFLISIGWAGTTTPHYSELTPANIKEACLVILNTELKTMVRTPSKLAKLVEQLDHPDAPLLSKYILDGDMAQINALLSSRFKGDPEFAVNSPKQMQNFLYGALNLPVHVVNATTALERQNKPLLARVISDHKKKWAGHETQPIPSSMFEAPANKEQEIRSCLTAKGRTDDTAIDFALAMDVEDKPDVARILKSVKAIKTCKTRESLYYIPYTHLQHWKDRKIHGQMGQCRTVTRRFAPSDPNLAQLPKKAEGIQFRECYIPHRKNAVIVSIDFAGQELRQGAGQSMDTGMLDCFIGDNKKDMHSMTAAGAMVTKWGREKVEELANQFGQPGDTDYDLFLRLRASKEADIHKMADDLRKNAKNVNFGAQYDAQAPKLAETLVIPVQDAEAFLQAKYAAFPRFEEWKNEVKEEAESKGYVTTPLGARRHLRDSLLSDEWGRKDKALRQGPNFRIQGGSAEQTKLAMGRLWDSGILFDLDMSFFAPIHDELVWSVTVEDCLASIKVVLNAMTQPYGNLPVPFLGSVAIGLNFGDMAECGDDAAEDPSLLDVRVPEILNKLFLTRAK